MLACILYRSKGESHHRHPSLPRTPRKRRRPNASSGAITSVRRLAIQNVARRNGSSVPLKKYDMYKIKSGMLSLLSKLCWLANMFDVWTHKPPCKRPMRTRQMKKDALPLSQNCPPETSDHMIIWVYHSSASSDIEELELHLPGIHTSGPIFLLTS